MDGNAALSIMKDMLANKAELKEKLEESTAAREEWLKICNICKEKFIEADKGHPDLSENETMSKLSAMIPENVIVCADVGQHQMWTATSFAWKENQRFLSSGGHGAMGFSIPAAIGAHYASGKPVVVICGDGSAQMNIQELQWVYREQIPVMIFVMNNQSLGLIRQQQNASFGKRYYGATSQGGYEAPDFEKIGKAYGISSRSILADNISALLEDDTLEHKDGKVIIQKPELVQVLMKEDTKAFPKTVFGESMYNQQPYVANDLLEELKDL